MRRRVETLGTSWLRASRGGYIWKPTSSDKSIHLPCLFSGCGRLAANVSVRGLQRAEVERLYEAHGRVLLAYACTFVRSVAAAEDVVHQVFARLLRGDLVITGPPLPYLCRAVRNAALNDRRSRAREETLGEEVGWLEAPSRMEDSALAVEQAMALLPPEQREVVVLHIWGGLTFQEVAEILAIPPNTAASRYRYALGRLRETMKPVGQT